MGKQLEVTGQTEPAVGVNRRDALQTLFGSAAMGIAIPGLYQDHPLVHQVEAAASTVEGAAQAAAATDWKLEFLDQHQFETFRSLAERIVPGASQAKVAEFVDQLLAVGTEDTRRGFLNALGIFEGAARARGGRPWKDLTAADQDAILREASTMAPARVADKPWTKGDPIQPPTPRAEPAPLTLRDHFDALKGWVAGAYYSSEIGMRELGWTGTAFHQAFPGCEHADGHQQL